MSSCVSVALIHIVFDKHLSPRQLKYKTACITWHYNSMRLAITGYDPHYLIFGCQPCLPVDFYILTIRSMKKHQCVDQYVAKLHEWLWETFKEAEVQSTSETERQKQYCDRKANAISMEPGNLFLANGNAYKRRGKWRTGGRRNCMKCLSLLTSWGTSGQDAHEFSTETDFFSLLLQRGLLSVWLCKLSGPGAPPPP